MKHNITADALIEIRTEELPPKALPNLLASFHEQVKQGLEQGQFTFDSSHTYASPRRMTLIFNNLSGQQPEQTIERKGPAVSQAYGADGKPTPALLGFVKSCQTTLEQLVEVDTPKGKQLCYRATVPGKSIQEILPELVKKALANLPIPKMMRWGDNMETFVRPVHGVVMLYGEQVIDATILGIKTSQLTIGHRFHAPEPFLIAHPHHYVEEMRKAKVLVDVAERRESIRQQVEVIAKQQGAQAVIPEDLLNEVTHIVEWPVALLCEFNPEFLQVPQEALILSMQTNQKCFPLTDATGKLLSSFVVVSNIESKHPDVVIHGNEKVVRARLSDAQFFYQTDLKKRLEDYLPDLNKVTFQARLGSVGEKVDRVVRLAGELATLRGANVEMAKRAAQLCKCDLLSSMVNEFPELQGVMGRYYALHQGEPAAVAEAIVEHYQPKFSGDALPASEIGQIVSLADKLDTLVGIFAIGEKPTGSKDPFALRRQAIGVLRILVDKEYRNVMLYDLLKLAAQGYTNTQVNVDVVTLELIQFFRERLVPFYEEKGISADIVESVLAVDRAFMPVQIDWATNAVKQFCKLPEAPALIEANKRVYNILSKNNALKNELSDPALLQEPTEQALYKALKPFRVVEIESADSYIRELCRLAELQKPIDRFFTDIMVMVDDPHLRQNRLALLNEIRNLFLLVADIRLLNA